MMQKPAEIFGKFVAETTINEIPESAFIAAKHIIADCIGAIIGGMAEPDIQALVQQFELSLNNEIPILGTNFKADRATASLIHGTAGTVLEIDEGHQFARGHPGMHVLPALLAYVQGKGVTGHDFLRAFIIGYDVAARIGQASELNSHMHPHGTWGGIGAAAALAAVEKCDAEDTARLINISSSLTLATSRKTMLEGGTVRNAYTGASNQLALLSMTLLKAGFSGEKDGISSVFGNIVSRNFDTSLAFEDLGKRFELCRNYFKIHACCRFNHAALDALEILIAQYPKLEDANYLKNKVKTIDVESYHLAAELADKSPSNVLACKFSIPFAIATTLYHQSSGVLSFTEDARINPDIQAICQKVQVSEDQNMTAQLPVLRPARVSIRLNDGSALTADVSTNRGDWQDPYAADELKQKFLSMTTRLWSLNKANHVHQTIMLLDETLMDDVIVAMVS